MWIRSEDPRLFNRQFSHTVRVVNVKMLRPLVFARHVEAEIMKVQKPMSLTLNEKPDIALSVWYSEVIGEGTRIAMPKTICASDNSSLKPGSGAAEGVQD